MLPYVVLFGLIVFGAMIFSLVSWQVKCSAQNVSDAERVSQRTIKDRVFTHIFRHVRRFGLSAVPGVKRQASQKSFSSPILRRFGNLVPNRSYLLSTFGKVQLRKKFVRLINPNLENPSHTNAGGIPTKFGRSGSIDKREEFLKTLSPEKERSNSEKLLVKVRLVYCIFIGVALISLCGLRAVTVGFGDNVIYARGFYKDKNLEIHDVVDSIIQPENYGYDDGRDFTFYLMVSTLGKTFPHHQYLFYICAILSISGYVWLIYRYSPVPYLSFLLFVSLGYFTFSMTGIRQAIALGICCFSYQYLTDRKLVPFILVVFIASLFHKTAIIFLPAYWLYAVQLNKKVVLLYALSFGFVLLASQYVNTIFLAFSSFDSRIESYVTKESTNLTFWGLAIHLSVLAFCCLGYNSLKKEKDSKYVGMFLLLGTGVLGLLYDVVRFSIFFRLVMYYSLYEIILVPRVVQSFRNRTLQLTASISIGICCIFYFFQGLTDSVFYPYLFFWEDNESLHFDQLMNIF